MVARIKLCTHIYIHNKGNCTHRIPGHQRASYDKNMMYPCTTTTNNKNSLLFMATVALTLLYGQAVRADDDFHLEEGYCAPYNGKVCKSFISSGQVWYSREDSTGGWENEKITTNLWEELIQGLTGLCREAAEVSSWLALFLYLG